MNRAFIVMGANLGDRMASLTTARRLIAEHCGEIVLSSSIYETAAWGKEDQPAFLNQALELHTLLNARQLIRYMLKIEKMMGRVRHEKYGPRLIDLDLILFNDEKYNYHFLKLPHPEMQNRRFVLVPLTEIAPDIVHPVLHQSIASLLAQCPDQLEVRKITDDTNER